MDKIDKYVKLLIKAASNHAIYLWGAQGEKVLSISEDDIYRMETSSENAERVLRYIKTISECGWLTKKTKAYDCSGLVCYCLVKAGIEEPGFDMTADDLFERYSHQNVLKYGSLLHRKGHIATYIGNKHLIEAKGRDYGVVVSPYNYTEWDKVFADPRVASQLGRIV